MMAYVTEKQTVEKKIYVAPCIKCGSEDIDLGDCGYSSFNVAWGRCKKCKNEVKINPCQCYIKKSEIAEFWNEANDPDKIRIDLEGQIADLKKQLKSLPRKKKI